MTYSCRYCRLDTAGDVGISCPSCGAPVDITRVVSRSGWEQQPAIPDMAHIQFGNSHVQIEGSQVPVAEVSLQGDQSIYFGHHSLLWTDPSTRITSLPMSGGWNRMLAGMPLRMLSASGPGHIALSDNHAGEIVALPLAPGRAVWTREHRFLTASAAVKYDWERTGIWFTTGSGNDRETHYPLGQFGDVFHAPDGPGLLLLHSPGNTFIRDLAPGESILVQPIALLYRDLSVGTHLHLEYPDFTFGRSFWSSKYSHRYVWLRLTGPGRVAVQSIFARHEESLYITGTSGHSTRSW